MKPVYFNLLHGLLSFGLHAIVVAYFCLILTGQFVRPTSLPEAALSNINSYGAGSPVFVGKHMHHMPLSGKNSVTSTLSYGGESVSPNQPHPPPSTSSAVSTLSTTSTLCQVWPLKRNHFPHALFIFRNLKCEPTAGWHLVPSLDHSILRKRLEAENYF